MAGINPVIDPLQRKLVCGPEEGQNTTVDGFQVNVIGDTGSGLYNAGDGINIEGSTINVALTAGYRGAVSGSTVGFVPSADIVTVAGASVTLQPDTAYKIYATASAVTLNANVPAAGKWAYDGHIELFVAGAGYIVTGTNVVLANALEPDSVNNCTVRFHDGIAIISVEDHIAGYVVVSATGTTAGTLPYALTSSTQEYIAFDATTNGATVDLSGATASGEKHVVGNGYTSTTLTGAVDCGTSKFTVANLSLLNVAVNGGTLTLGDAYIPSGSTVAVSGGGLAFERVNGSGIIDAGGSAMFVSATTAHVSGIITSNGRFNVYSAGHLYLTGTTHTKTYATGNGGGITITGTGHATLENVLITGNRANYGAGVYCTGYGTIDHCIISGNTATSSGAIYINYGGQVTIKGSTVTGNVASGAQVYMGYDRDSRPEALTIEDSVVDDVYLYRNSMTIIGSCNIKKITGSTGSVVLTSGATLDLTGNENPTPIAPGGGVIVFEGCTVITSGGASVYIAGGTYTKINNDGTTVPPQE